MQQPQPNGSSYGPHKKLVRQTGAVNPEDMNQLMTAQIQASVAMPEMISDLTEAVLSLVVCQKAVALAALHRQLETTASTPDGLEMTQTLKQMYAEVESVETEMVNEDDEENGPVSA